MKKIIILAAAVFLVFSVTGVNAADYAGKRVLYIDSYHEGYPWSDGVTRGVKSVIEGSGAKLRVARMDTKRNKSDAFKKEAALKMKALIEEYRPDVVIASDDNASKYLIVPYFKDKKLPFVFCGVNWDASVYGFPFSNVTGMIEISDTLGLIEQLKQFAKGDRVGFIAGDTLTDRKAIGYYQKLFQFEVPPYFAKDFEDWKKGFTEIQKKTDLLIVNNFVGIEGWDKAAAAEFAQTNTKIPTGTMLQGTMDYALLGFLKLPEEQGTWAAQAALKILDGTPPADIEIVPNQNGKLMLNLKIAQGMGVEIPYDLIENAQELIE